MWLITLFFVIGTSATANAVDVVPDEFLSNTELIEKYGGSQSKKLLVVAKCESSLNENAINKNDGGKGKHSIGIMQFQESTFDFWSNKMGDNYDYYSKVDQIKVAKYMFDNKQEWQWTCSKLLKGV